MKENRTTKLLVYLTNSEREALKALAEKEGRTMSSYTQRLITHAIAPQEV